MSPGGGIDDRRRELRAGPGGAPGERERLLQVLRGIRRARGLEECDGDMAHGDAGEKEGGGAKTAPGPQ